MIRTTAETFQRLLLSPTLLLEFILPAVFKKILVFFSVFILLIIAAAIAFAYFYGDEVKAYAIQSLNKQLKAKVDVGKVSFSVLRTFPMASLEFEDVIAMETWQKSNLDTLFFAESVFLKFNVWDIYKQEYKVKELEFQDAKLNLIVDEAGTKNFDFWESSEENDTSAKTLSFTLERLLASNVDFRYEHKANQLIAHFDLEETYVGGDFRKSIFSADVKSNFAVQELSSKDASIFPAKQIAVNGNIAIDTEKSTYQFEKTLLNVDGLEVLLDGGMEVKEETHLNIVFSGKEVDINHVLAILNIKKQKHLQEYEIKGKAELNGALIGTLTSKDQLHFEMDFHVWDALFKYAKSKIALNNIELQGKYSSGAKNTKASSTIDLEKFSAKLGNGEISGKLILQDLEKPKYSLECAMDLQLSEISHLFDFQNLQKMEGNVMVHVKSNGILHDIGKISVNDWKNASSIGSMEFNDVSFQLIDRPQSFRNFSGKLKIVNNSLLADNLKGEISSSDFILDGKFINLIGFLLNENEPLMVEANLRSSHLELNELLLSNKQLKTEGKEDYHFSISDRINIKLKAEIEHLDFRKFSFKNCKSDILIRNQMMIADNIHFESMGGSVDGKLQMDARNDGFLLMQSESSSKNINVKELFHDMDNFGQQVLTHSNIDGIASAEIHFTSRWSPSLKMDQSSLVLESDFMIEKGRLMDFEPLKKLSKYISLEELNDIHFSTLQNSIQIKDDKIYIPDFEIKSSAMDLSLEGTHTFDNKVDYRMELIVDQLLGMKIKKPKKQDETEFGYVEDDGLGRSKLFLRMSGDLDNPNISYDTQQLKEHWKKEIKSENEEIKKMLKDEFGKKDKVDDMKNTDSNDADKKSAPFMIEWGEDEKTEDEEKKLEASKPESRKEKKSAFNKFFDKIAEPNQDEYIHPSSE